MYQINGAESVFCIIDGISFYEALDEDLLQDMAYVLRSLLDLTRRKGTVFKILVTSPSTTVDTRQAIEDEDYLTLPEQAKNIHCFSDLRFERSFQEGFLQSEHD